MFNSPQPPEATSERAEFDALFTELTGIDPNEALTDKNGWLFIPLAFQNEPEAKRGRLGKLAGPSGWKNYLAKGKYAGYLMHRPD